MMVFKCLYSQGRMSSGSVVITVPGQQERLLELIFTVLWHADVRANGRFYNITVDDIIVNKTSFQPVTEEQLKNLTSQEENM